jgi:endonuclease III
MPTITNKQRALTHLFALVKKHPMSGEAEPRPVLEQFIYGICREGATRAQSDRAFANLRSNFYDWNEVRVSSPREIEEAMEDLPDAEGRAQRLLSFLQEVFESTFAYDLESLHKKKGGLKEASRFLSKYEAANEYVNAWVVQQSLGGHAIPLDEPTLRLVKRLGLIDPDEEDLDTVRSSLEHTVPKAKGALFVDLVSDLAHDVCMEEAPNCAGCPLHSDCPTGQELARAVRPKPR